MEILVVHPSGRFVPRIRSQNYTEAALLACALAAPSLFSAYRYAGSIGIIVVALISIASLWMASRSFGFIRSRELFWVIGFIAVTTILYLIIFPIVDNPDFASGGSDRDEAYDLALKSIMQGHYPYESRTYLDGPITPLPGGFLLALPAYLISDTSAGMAVIWTGASIVILQFLERGLASALIIGLLPSVGFWQDVVQGGDLVATSLIAFSVGAVAIWTATNKRPPLQEALILAALGLVCAVRFSGVAVLWPTIGPRRAVARGVCAFLVFLVCWVPLWLIRPASFSPLHVSELAGGRIGLAAIALVTALLVWRWIVRPQRRPTQSLAAFLALWALASSLVAAGDALWQGTTISGAFWLLGYGVFGLLATVAVTDSAIRPNQAALDGA